MFPCGSEIALEIYRSLQYSTHFNLIGANSIDDHGKFIFDNYIGNIPFVTSPDFIEVIKKVVIEFSVDAIYPAMDGVINILKKNEKELGCKVITSSVKTTEICLSKLKSYKILEEFINVPKVYNSLEEVENYPVFMKPEIGYGSRGAKKINNSIQGKIHLEEFRNCIITEYLPGKEYTIDCFTDYKGNLIFFGARERKRISNGISVNTTTISDNKLFKELATKINKKIDFEGAWFFQLKERENGVLVLLEIAARFGGSSGVYRMQGVNFAALSLFSAFGYDVVVEPNNYEVTLDRALDCKFSIDINFNHVYVDFDDVILLNESIINPEMISLIFYFINNQKKVYLITKHNQNIYETLSKYRIKELFDEIIHLDKSKQKWKYIKHIDAIFIDDSYAERNEVQSKLKLPVFSPEMAINLKIT